MNLILQKLVQNKKREWIAFLIMQVLLISFCFQTYEFLNKSEQQSYQNEMYEIGLLEKNNFERDLQHRLLAFDRLALRTRDTSKITRQNWYEDVKNYYRDFHGTIAIEFVNKDSKIEWIYPAAGNEEVVGKKLNQSGERKVSLQESISRRLGTYTEPLDLIQGGRGFLSFHPVFDKKNDYLGYIVGVFDGEKYFSELESFDFYIEVSIAGKLVFSNLKEIQNLEINNFRQSIPLKLSGAQGKLTIIPNQRYLTSIDQRSKALEFVLAIFVVGFLISLIILSYVHFLVKQEAQRINAIEVSRLAYAGKLSAGLAHEINNPLAIVKASTKRLSRYNDFSDSKSAKILEDVFRAVSRIQKLTQKLVFFVERPVANQAPVSLAGLASESIELHSKELEGIRVQIISNLNRDYLIKYPVRFKLCLDQLFNNSIEALRGRLDAKITLTISDTNNFIKIVLADNGVGIDAESLKEVFSPFYTTKSLKSGAGLGLSFVEKIVQDFNGQVHIKSKEREGTEVVIKLPKSELRTSESQQVKQVC